MYQKEHWIKQDFNFKEEECSKTTSWRLLVYLQPGPCCFLLYPARVTLEWCFEYFLTFLHIAREILSAPSPKENMNLPIFHQKARPLDQVFAEVCKSLNEVACLTFSSLILFSTKIRPVNIESREEMWKNLNRRRISFLQGCSSSCDAWSLARCSRHMNNFCISASPPTYTNIPGILWKCRPAFLWRNYVNVVSFSFTDLSTGSILFCTQLFRNLTQWWTHKA